MALPHASALVALRIKIKRLSAIMANKELISYKINLLVIAKINENSCDSKKASGKRWYRKKYRGLGEWLYQGSYHVVNISDWRNTAM